VLEHHFCAPRFEPCSVPGLTLLRKGGGKPPHSKVGWLRVGGGGYAIVFVGSDRWRSEDRRYKSRIDARSTLSIPCPF
jgi:hypothetical protein